VAIATERGALNAPDLTALERRGHPVLRLSSRASALGAEFFRWEFAVAVAGAMLGINPFDEPNVQEAKDRTRALLDAYVASGTVPEDPPEVTDGPFQAFGPLASSVRSPAAAVRNAVSSLAPGDYLALLSYLPADPAVDRVLQRFRKAVRDRTRAATTLGLGPRYLHSTGQYHKGGPNRAVCLLLTCEDDGALGVPGAPYSFATLKRAQALGDLQSLVAHERRVVRLHLAGPAIGMASTLDDLLAQSLV
jgi:hypothetical protein